MINDANDFHKLFTVEPSKKGHFGSRSFVLCLGVVPISEVPTVLPLLTIPFIKHYDIVSYCLAIKIEFCRRNPW